jgi:hypothetical protein
VARSARLGTRRALVIYVSAVVGPTLVVLAAGALAVRRQADALDTLQVTTRSLLEVRIAEEVERQAIDRAGAALRDTRLGAVATLAPDASPEDIDRARLDLRDYHLAHPIVQDVVVMEGHHVVYPRVEPPLPIRVDTWLRLERHGQQVALTRQISQAEASEGDGALRTRSPCGDDPADDRVAVIPGRSMRSAGR